MRQSLGLAVLAVALFLTACGQNQQGALGRRLDPDTYDDFIQVDAPINKGNSRGPSFDMDGEVVGVNTAIFSPSGGSVGIGFAIPSTTVKPSSNGLGKKA
jgi:serine protease Do